MNENPVGGQPKTGPWVVWVNTPEPGELPEGLTHHTFYSEANGANVGHCIYMPPGYESNEAPSLLGPGK